MAGLGQLGRLPAEIRQEIYTLVLKYDSLIPIEMWSESQPVSLDLHKCYENKTVYASWTWSWHSVRPSALLKASKRLKDEAAPVLYGSNIFIFRNTEHLYFFLRQSPEMSQYLRHIMIAMLPILENVFLKKAGLALVVAKNLRRLEISHVDFCRMTDFADAAEKLDEDIKILVENFLPMLQSLQANIKAADVDVNILDITTIFLPPCNRPRLVSYPWARTPRSRNGSVISTNGRHLQLLNFEGRFIRYGVLMKYPDFCNCPSASAEAVNDDFNRKLRAEIAKRLNMIND
ncbi:hypothetical protein Q7P37_011468 [Cladosporium fusiforme]